MATTFPERKKRFRKAGRTLLIKPVQDNFDFSTLKLDDFKGLQTNSLTKSGARFLVFDDIDNSSECLKQLKTVSDVLVKYAHYRLYFTINGLEDDDDYNAVKEAHIGHITNITNCDVLYYKLYKKNKEKFLGCGDLTIDTKEGMDVLLQNEDNKSFSILNDKLTGQFFQYNKFRSTNRYDDEDQQPHGHVVKTKHEQVTNN
jgi:hypothetical protein